MRIELKRGNDQVVQLPGLRLRATPTTYLNAATVVGTLYDSHHAVVPGYGAVTFSYVVSSNGTYEWVIDGKYFMLASGTLYSLEITARQEEKDFRAVYEVTIAD